MFWTVLDPVLDPGNYQTRSSKTYDHHMLSTENSYINTIALRKNFTRFWVCRWSHDYSNIH